MPYDVKQAMARDNEFRQWVETKVVEKPDRMYQPWFRQIIEEWADSILRE